MGKYNEHIYDEIMNDHELNSFISSVNEYSNEIYRSTKEKLEDKLEKIKIDYTQLFALIEKLKETGIVITNNDTWFGIKEHYTRGMPERYEIENDFFNAKYNGIHILDADYTYIQMMVIYKKKGCTERFICRSELEYEDLMSQYKNIDAVENSLKKLLKKRKKQEKNWYKSWVTYDSSILNKIEKTEESLKIGKELKNKLEFLQGLSDKQIEIIYNLYGTFMDMCLDYFDKRMDVETQIEQNKIKRITNSTDFFNKGFLKFIEENGNEVNIKSIEMKLTKLLILNSLNRVDRNQEILEDVYLKSQTEFEKSIDWFIELKDDKISKITDLFTKNIDLILEEQKVLKK